MIDQNKERLKEKLLNIKFKIVILYKFKKIQLIKYYLQKLKIYYSQKSTIQRTKLEKRQIYYCLKKHS